MATSSATGTTASIHRFPSSSANDRCSENRRYQGVPVSGNASVLIATFLANGDAAPRSTGAASPKRLEDLAVVAGVGLLVVRLVDDGHAGEERRPAAAGLDLALHEVLGHGHHL